jgi:hypothetical protein
MVKDLIKSCKKHEKNALENVHIVDEYQAIGTIDEFKALKQFKNAYEQVKCERDVAISQLEEIGISLGQKMDDIKALKEKNEPKKPLRIPDDDTCIYYGYYCPCCNEPLSNTARMERCFCGQTLDWS